MRGELDGDAAARLSICVSFTIDLPPDLEEQARAMPDLNQQLVAFIRNRAEYEKWRNARYSERARRLLSEGYAEADRLKAEGITDEEIDRQFQEVIDWLAPER